MDPEVFFISGMGSPNTFISSNSLSISVQKIFSDRGIEIRYSNLIDLDGKGSLHETGFVYEVYENIKLLITLNKIISNKSIHINPFTGMENFSHIRCGLKYYY